MSLREKDDMIWLFGEDAELGEGANFGSGRGTGDGLEKAAGSETSRGGWKAGEKGGNDAIMLDIFYSKKG